MADTRQPTPCQVRRAICARWNQLIDDLWWLEHAVRSAPPGTFTDAEVREAEMGLGDKAWDGLMNYRPRLPASAARRTLEPLGGLPDALRYAPNSERTVYRVVLALRAGRPDAPIWPRQIAAECERIGEELSPRSIYRALAILTQAGLLTRQRGRGYSVA